MASLLVTIGPQDIDPIVASWSGRVTAGGGSIPTLTTLEALTDFTYGLKADNIFTKMISVNAFVPDSLIASITPVIQTSGSSVWTNNNFVSADLTVNGLLGNGSNKWLDTGVNVSTAYGNDTSAGLSVYESTTTVSNVCAIGAAANSSTTGLELFTNSFGGAILFDCWNNSNSTGRLATSVPTASGFTSGNRTAANDFRTYFGNSNIPFAQQGIQATTGNSHSDTNFTIGCFVDHVTTGNFFFSNRRMSFAAIHTGLTSTECNNFFNRVQTLRQAFRGGFS